MIADALERQSINQSDLARILGRGLATVQAWIGGRSIPEMTPEETLEMCQVFNCSLEELAKLFPGKSRRRAAIKSSHPANSKKEPPNE